VTLTELDGKSIAVVLANSSEPTALRGRAKYQVHPDMGSCLRILLAGEPGNPILFFPESAASQFEVDRRYGCEYAVTLEARGRGSDPDPAQPRTRTRHIVGSSSGSTN
jgi:hypothetical protein